MADPIQVGNITIHRIVEQEAPMFGAYDFFPTLTKEMLDENRSWLVVSWHSGLRRKSRTPGRCPG